MFNIIINVIGQTRLYIGNWLMFDPYKLLEGYRTPRCSIVIHRYNIVQKKGKLQFTAELEGKETSAVNRGSR